MAARSSICSFSLVVALFALAACGGTAPATPSDIAASPQTEAQTDPSPPAEATEPTSTATPEPTPTPESTNTPTSEPTITPTPEPTLTPTPEPTPTVAVEPGASRNNPLPMGQEIRFETWAVTPLEITRGAEAASAIATANQFNEPPRDGHEYVLVTVRVENIGEEQTPQDPSFGVDLRLTGDRNILYSRASVVVPEPLEGQLFPEGVATGQVAFEAPSEEGNLLLSVNESLSFDAEPRFVALEEGARVAVDPMLARIEPSDVGTQRSDPAPVGETVTTENWEATVLQMVRGGEAAALMQSANQFNEPAPEGTEYVAVKLRVRYIGTDQPDRAEQVYSSGLFRITGEQNVVYENVSVVPPSPALDAYLLPGGQIEGWAVFGIASGEQQLALIFEPLFSFSGDEVRFLALQ